MKPKQKTLLLVPKEPYWDSFVHVRALIKHYKKAHRNLQISEIPEDQSPTSLLLWAKGLPRCNRIIWLGGTMHPKSWLLALWVAWGEPRGLELFLHIYASVINEMHFWIKLEPILKLFRTQFIVNSNRMKYLLSSLLKVDGGISVLNIPLQRSFKFNIKKRKSLRKKLGLGPDDTLFVYSGRISLQKNILELLDCFAEAAQNKKIYLVICGDMDGRGAEHLGLEVTAPKLQEAFVKKIKSLGPGLHNKVKWLGPLDASMLSQVYCASDCFISLSTFHGEDYGLSPMEALGSGSGLILTNWGGYGGYQSFADMIRVFFDTKNQIILDSSQVKKSLKSFQSLGDKERIKRSHIAYVQFGETATVKKIKTVLQLKPRAFKGFNKRAQKLANALEKTNGCCFVGKKNQDLYKEIFKNFVR